MGFVVSLYSMENWARNIRLRVFMLELNLEISEDLKNLIVREDYYQQ